MRLRQATAVSKLAIPFTLPGEEEIPEGCVAVLTPDAPDVLSHVSVRARNMKVRKKGLHACDLWDR